tara:strand:+ start:1924 stop:2361 length:438 start_codon:yes stop_codon:yes gene_type:complete
MANKLDKEYSSIKATKARLKLNPEISVDQVKGYDRRARASPFIMEHVKIIQSLTDENEKLKAENEKLREQADRSYAKNKHEQGLVKRCHEKAIAELQLRVTDTRICLDGICKGKTYEEAKRIIIDKEGYEYWELWRKRVNWEFCN